VSFEHLPTLAEMRAKPLALPKSATPKTDHAKAVQRSASADRRALTAWANTVKKRDKWKDRYDGQRVIRIIGPHPRRAEAHHIVSRADQAVRYDVRNGLTLSLENHEKVERGLLRIVGTKFFTVNGRKYTDGTHTVIFQED